MSEGCHRGPGLAPSGVRRARPMFRLAALVFSAWVLLSGCTGPTYSYSKPDGSPMDFKRDSYACVQESRVSWGASGNAMIIGASIDAKRQANRLSKRCVEARAWTAEPSQ